MNMNKIAQALRLLADAFDGTELTEGTLTTADPVGVAGMAEPAPAPPTPEPKPEPAQPTMTMEEFTTAMQAMGREVGPSKLHAALPAVWEKYTNGVARMSAIPADRYAEIVRFTRDAVSRSL